MVLTVYWRLLLKISIRTVNYFLNVSIHNLQYIIWQDVFTDILTLMLYQVSLSKIAYKYLLVRVSEKFFTDIIPIKTHINFLIRKVFPLTLYICLSKLIYPKAAFPYYLSSLESISYNWWAKSIFLDGALQRFMKKITKASL